MTGTPEKIFQRVREICLSYSESHETNSWGHPNFCAGKKAFVTFERWEGRPSIAFRVQDTNIVKLSRHGEFFVTPYGREKWVSVWIDNTPLDWRLIEELIDKAFRLVALKRMLLAARNPAP